MLALASRRKGSVGARIPAAFTGHLMTDGYTGYQHLLNWLAGIQQCCQHTIRRCGAVQKLGPGGAQNWVGDIIAILGEQPWLSRTPAPAAAPPLDQQVLDDLRERYDIALKSGIIHNRLRAPGLGHRQPPRSQPRGLGYRCGAGVSRSRPLVPVACEVDGHGDRAAGASCSLDGRGWPASWRGAWPGRRVQPRARRARRCRRAWGGQAD